MLPPDCTYLYQTLLDNGNYIYSIYEANCLVGLLISVSDYYSKGHGFDSHEKFILYYMISYLCTFSFHMISYIRYETGFTQSHENDWIST
jgi:hypothetical protein